MGVLSEAARSTSLPTRHHQKKKTLQRVLFVCLQCRSPLPPSNHALALWSTSRRAWGHGKPATFLIKTGMVPKQAHTPIMSHGPTHFVFQSLRGSFRGEGRVMKLQTDPHGGFSQVQIFQLQVLHDHWIIDQFRRYFDDFVESYIILSVD